MARKLGIKATPTLVLALLFASGCQTAQLRHATVHQAGSITDLYYLQVMDNIAMHCRNPGGLPYFSQPQTGQNSTQYSLSLGATSEWDLVTSATRLLGAFAFSKQNGAITGSDTNIEMWNTAPTIVPNKLILMKYAYECAFGDMTHYADLAKVIDYEYNSYHLTDKVIADAEQAVARRIKTIAQLKTDLKTKTDNYRNAQIKAKVDDDIIEEWTDKIRGTTRKQQDELEKQTTKDVIEAARLLLEQEKVADELDDLTFRTSEDQEKLKLLRPTSLAQFSTQYTTKLSPPGWFEIGGRSQIPKNARYVGHYGNTYAWIRPGNEERLADFTLIILNIATFEAPDREKRTATPGFAGKSSSR